MQQTYITNRTEGLVAIVSQDMSRLSAGTVVRFGYHKTSDGRVVNSRKGKITRGKKWDAIASKIHDPLYAIQIRDGLEPEFLLR